MCEGIEAWTFEQNEGEAVLIPAGCPYQVRNLKVCLMRWIMLFCDFFLRYVINTPTEHFILVSLFIFILFLFLLCFSSTHFFSPYLGILFLSLKRV
jgi:hypothetical protein